MINNRVRNIALAIASFSALVASTGVATVASTGCANSSDDGAVHGRMNVINSARSALSDSDVASMSLTGTYGGGCTARTGNWTSADLSVVKNNAACVLTITGLALAETYATNPLAYKLNGSGNTKFLGNAVINDAAFSDEFEITVRVSDDSSWSDAGAKAADYATHSATLTAENVDAPSYTADFSTLTIQKDVDNVVPADGVTGFVTLSGTTAQLYKIHEGSLDYTSFSAVDTAFGAGSTLTGLSNHLPASDFDALDGQDLDTPRVWTIILRNTESVSGVYSYQLIEVTFTP
jgi:hypothetical protein